MTAQLSTESDTETETDSDAAQTQRGSDYARLSRLIKQHGLLERRRVYYGIKIGLTLAGFFAGWVAMVLVGNSWWQLAVAAYLGVMFTQVAFLGHDAGHRQIFRSKKANDTLGLVHGNLLVGLSYGWWIDKHNRHHAHPNQVGHDPDIDMEAIAFTDEQAMGRRGSFGRFMAKYQAWLFFPMLLLEGLAIRVSSIKALLSKEAPKRRGLESALMVVHLVVYVALPFLLMSPLMAVSFIAIQQGIFGLYMGCSFAPNHKGMEIFAEDSKVDFFRRQVLTSRNIRGSKFVDFALGGLNYQIEHHLFPSMPRPNLRKAQKLIRDYCQEHGVSYAETGPIRSYVEVLSHLHSVGAPLRAAS